MPNPTVHVEAMVQPWVATRLDQQAFIEGISRAELLQRIITEGVLDADEH